MAFDHGKDNAGDFDIRAHRIGTSDSITIGDATTLEGHIKHTIDANDLDFVVVDERVEHAGRVAAAADAGYHFIRQPA